jgi:anti-sigma regulatory factor (Ser/Thr protein kinase)/HAMP domain-containing protein
MNSRNFGIRAAFRIGMCILGLLALVIIFTYNYQSETASEYARADASVQSEVNYLRLQLASLSERAGAFDTIIADAGVAPEELAEAHPNEYDLLSDPVGDLLEGYTMAETGTVAIVADGKVLMTDDPRLTLGADLRGLIGDDAHAAVDVAIAEGRMQPISCEGALLPASGEPEDGYLIAGTQGPYTVVIVEPESMVFRNRRSVILRETAVSLGILTLALILVDRLLHITVARRIDSANEALQRITNGELDVRVEDTGTREFSSLASGINKTVDALQGWIAEAETRMDAELATAKAIQESVLPRTFPPYPDITKFDIYASMNAALDVGGDFYDFFLVGDDCGPLEGKLGFVVADVSGKGVPAALFMMRAKALIRDYVVTGMELGEAMTEVNRQLCEGNDEDMFVTAWVGLLDYGTGRIQYVNAGHNPPLLWQRASGWRWMRKRSGPMLGLFDTEYVAHAVDCAPGDTLLLYTDGVTEAFDVHEETYGEQRLLEVAKRDWLMHPRELLESVRTSIADYSAGAQQSDDITLLTLEVGVPPEVTSTLEVPAEIGELARVNDFLHAELDRRLCPKRVQNQLDVAVEELFVNVCLYAYEGMPEDHPRTVRVQRTYSADPSSITVDILDEGMPFNPLAKPDARTPSTIEEMPIGGLGILMAKGMVDEMSYDRVDGANVVTIVKRW